MDYQNTSASTNYNDNGPTASATESFIEMVETIADAMCSFKEFEKMCALLRSEKWVKDNDYPRHAFGHREQFRYFIVVKRNYYRRMMFCVSGHLPWRDRKRLKDR